MTYVVDDLKTLKDLRREHPHYALDLQSHDDGPMVGLCGAHVLDLPSRPPARFVNSRSALTP
jgi:hypothetical protein